MAFKNFLENLGDAVSKTRGNIIVAGDFNARSRIWDLVEGARGKLLFEWAVGLGLSLINDYGISTCSRWQGESVVDLTWCSSNCNSDIKEWRVNRELESLSDHFYISFKIDKEHCNSTSSNTFRKIRWNDKKMDRDFFLAILENYCWNVSPVSEDLDASIANLNRLLFVACRASMPRSPRRGKGLVY